MRNQRKIGSFIVIVTAAFAVFSGCDPSDAGMYGADMDSEEGESERIQDDDSLPIGSYSRAAVGPGVKTIVLNHSHPPNAVVTLPVDGLAIVELPSNPSTGFYWEITSPKTAKINVLGSEYIQTEVDRLGAPGIQRFYIAGAARGQAKFEVVYKRHHAADHQDKKSFKFASLGRFKGAFNLPPLPVSPIDPALTETRSRALPSHFNWCDFQACTPVKDQGACGSCWAFATAAPLESLVKYRDGVTVDLSEQYLVSCNSDGWGCNGGWFAHDYHLWKMITGETEAGAVLESVFPYTATDQACINQPHSKSNKLAYWQYVDSISVPSVDALKQAIYNNGPIAVAVCADQNMGAYSGGVFTSSCDTINHGVTLTGWDDTYGAWYMKNSWGPSWGENGYMRIAYGVSHVGYAATYVKYGPRSWRELPGKGKDIGVGANGQAFMIGIENANFGGYIYKWNGSAWQVINGLATRIDVGPGGEPWVINKENKIFKGDGAGNWTQLPGAAIDIGVGANGQAFMIGPINSSFGGSIYKWNGSAWQEISGLAVKIDVGPDGAPWVINKENKIFRGNGSGGWTQLPSRAIDIAVGANGDVYITGTDNTANGGKVYRWTGTAWQYINKYAVHISSDKNGDPWVINKTNKVSKYSFLP